MDNEFDLTSDQVAKLKAAHKTLHDLIEEYNVPAVIIVLAPEPDGVACMSTTRIDGPSHARILTNARAMGMAAFKAAKIIGGASRLTNGDPMEELLATMKMAMD